MYLLDTNIFLELLLNREHASECYQLLKKISAGETEAVVTSFSVHAVCGLLSKPPLVEAFLSNIVNSLGLSVYPTTPEEELEASVLAEKVGLDFDDGIQYFVAKKVGADAIVSFDKHFDRTDLPRLEPKKVLGES